MARCLTPIIWTKMPEAIVVVWPPHCVRHLGQHCFKYWLDAISVPGHYLNQSGLLVNGTLINALTRKQTRWHCSDGFSNAFCDWKLVNLIQQLIEIHFLWWNWDKVSIGWVNGSAPNWWQAIIDQRYQMPETIVVVWPHMMSDILVNIAWSINLTPYQCQVITSANPDLLSMKPLLTR